VTARTVPCKVGKRTHHIPEIWIMGFANQLERRTGLDPLAAYQAGVTHWDEQAKLEKLFRKQQRHEKDRESFS
jgi:hypothetical protein